MVVFSYAYTNASTRVKHSNQFIAIAISCIWTMQIIVSMNYLVFLVIAMRLHVVLHINPNVVLSLNDSYQISKCVHVDFAFSALTEKQT